MATAKKRSNKAPIAAPEIAVPAAPEVTVPAEPIEVEKVAAPRGLGIGKLIKDLVGQGKTNDEIMVAVKDAFPAASTNKACISWYRSDMKRRARAV